MNQPRKMYATAKDWDLKKSLLKDASNQVTFSRLPNNEKWKQKVNMKEINVKIKSINLTLFKKQNLINSIYVF